MTEFRWEDIAEGKQGEPGSEEYERMAEAWIRAGKPGLQRCRFVAELLEEHEDDWDLIFDFLEMKKKELEKERKRKEKKHR